MEGSTAAASGFVAPDVCPRRSRPRYGARVRPSKKVKARGLDIYRRPLLAIFSFGAIGCWRRAIAQYPKMTCRYALLRFRRSRSFPMEMPKQLQWFHVTVMRAFSPGHISTTISCSMEQGDFPLTRRNDAADVVFTFQWMYYF